MIFRDFIQHNIPAGEWIYVQRYFDDYLTWSGIGDPLQALLSRGGYILCWH